MDNTENRFKHEGVWYIAQDSIAGCFGCDAYEDSIMCGVSPPCSKVRRKDKRDVIFVESDADNLGDEE